MVIDGWVPCLVVCHICGREFGAAGARGFILHSQEGPQPQSQEMRERLGLH